MKPAPGWAALLGGHELDLRLVHRAFPPPFDPWCERIPRADDVLWALRSRSLDAADTAEEVAARATPLIERLNGVLAVHADAGRVHLDAVGHIDEQGMVRRQIFLAIEEVARASDMVTVSVEARDADGKPLPPEPSIPQRWIGLAEQDGGDGRGRPAREIPACVHGQDRSRAAVRMMLLAATRACKPVSA
jgi:hypothetical protein